MDRTTLYYPFKEIKSAVLRLATKIYNWKIGEPASIGVENTVEKKFQIKLSTDFVKMIVIILISQQNTKDRKLSSLTASIFWGWLT